MIKDNEIYLFWFFYLKKYDKYKSIGYLKQQISLIFFRQTNNI